METTVAPIVGRLLFEFVRDVYLAAFGPLLLDEEELSELISTMEEGCLLEFAIDDGWI